MTSHNNSYFQPKVYILSDETELSHTLTEKLLSKKCIVVTIKIDKNLGKLRSFLNRQNISGRSYFLTVLNNCGKYSRNFTDDILNEVIKFIESTDSKAIFAFPYACFTDQQYFYEKWNSTILDNKNIYAGTVFLGDVLSNTYKQNPASFVDQILSDYYSKSDYPNFSVQTPFNPISTDIASNALISALFSMGSFRTSSAVIGNDILLKELLDRFAPGRNVLTSTQGKTISLSHINIVQQLQRKDGDIAKLIEERNRSLTLISTSGERNGNHTIKDRQYATPPFVKKLLKILFQNKNFLPKLIIERFRRFTDKARKRVSAIPEPDKTKTIGLKKISIFKIGIILFTAILLPHVFLLISGASLYFSNYLLKASYISSSLNTVQFSKGVSNSARKLTIIYMKAPLIGKFYESLFLDSEFLIKEADLQTSYGELFKKFHVFINQSENNKTDDKTQIAKDISLEIDGIYSKTGFLEGEWLSGSGNLKIIQKSLFPAGDINRVKVKLLDIKKIVDQTNTIFGVNKPTNYLLLFEDNSQVRATGGKIVAYGVITFTDGKISDIQIMNFNDVDKKITGKIEPPEPLKKYFGKNSWYLSDSNWYVDFPSSAEKAEWFLDKGLDIPVDGVISIDSTALDKLSAATKLKISDPENPDPNELKEFLTNTGKLGERQTYKLMNKTISLLNEKHILIFSHNNETRNALNALAWDGSISDIDCVHDCYLDVLGIIESANGIGSENIKKEMDLKISVEEGLAKKTLTVFLENKNDFSYKTYLRILSGSNSGFSPVVITTQEEKQQVYPEIYGVSGYKEAGVYLEIKPLEAKAVAFSWENAIDNFTQMDRYTVLVRKQPGEQSYPVEIDLINKSKNLEKSTPVYSLTADGVWSYNTNLLSDFVSTFVWKR